MQQTDSPHPIDVWISSDPKSASNPGGRSRSGLAAAAGISASRMTQICDEGGFPRPKMAEKIEEITGIDARVLLGIPKHEDAA